MTVETRQFVTLDDIRALEFTCKNETCKARATIWLNSGKILPAKCPPCQREWLSSRPDSLPLRAALEDFQRSLRDLVRLRDEMGCALRFEIPLSDESLSNSEAG